MDGNDQEIVILRVISHPKTILNWFAFKVNGQSTFLSLLEATVIASKSNESKGRFSAPLDIDDKTKLKCMSVKMHPRHKQIWLKPKWNLTINDLIRSVGKYVTFSAQAAAERPHTNAFDRMMASARVQPDLFFPTKFGSTPDEAETRSDWRVKNTLVDLLKNQGAGFSSDKSASSLGKQFINVVGSSLHYILPHLKVLNARGCHMPSVYHGSVQGDINQNYVHPEKHKHKIKDFDVNILDGHVHDIYIYTDWASMFRTQTVANHSQRNS